MLSEQKKDCRDLLGQAALYNGVGDFLMTLHGQVRGGVIVLDPPIVLPEGADVQVEVMKRPADVDATELPSLFERLKPFVGAANRLPADFASQHDHYLDGTPKRSLRRSLLTLRP